MEERWNQRTELLIGIKGIEKLKKATVIIYGIGGVGSYVAEGLARAGVGKLILVDPDDISITNINRQIHATRSTVGKSKVEVMKERVLDICPETIVETYRPEDIENGEDYLIDEKISYVVDAVDTVYTKIKLVERAKDMDVPIISSMGAGNKLSPEKFEISDIYKTSVCPLAKKIRKELKQRGIKKLKVVYSKEEPIKPNENCENSCKNNCICPPGTKRKCTIRNQVPGSISFVPSVAGLIIAGEVIKDILKK